MKITALIDMLRANGDLVHPATPAGGSPDPGAEKFLACALAAHADFMVTGNRRDFPADPIKPTKVVSAGELLNLITLEL
jgi:predicted nucleic acid-binding protein